MHPFGGNQLCPRCSKAVYAAEQIMGPGRKLYHKPCLSCLACKKRLDSYTLVEHDQEPYCKTCYTKNFSTRDLRQANLPVREASVSPTPASPPRAANNTTFAQSLPPLPPRVAPSVPRNYTNPTPSLPRPTPSPPLKPIPSFLDATIDSHLNLDGNELESIPEADSTADTTTPLVGPLSSPTPQRRFVSPPPSSNSLPHLPSSPVSSSTAVNTPTSESQRISGLTYGKRNNTTSAALSLLEKEGINPLVQTTTGTRYGTALGGKVSVNMTGTPTGGSPRKWGSETPLCSRCSQRVYFAEQVKAVGQTWHKNCLRCRECNTLLDSNRLRDHDGVPFCVRCYSKLHGPQGGGYALLGKAGS